jgi:gas vesicle protein
MHHATENLTERAERLREEATERFAGRVDDLRDTVAETLGDQAREELKRLRAQIRRANEGTDRVIDRVDALEDRLEEHTDRLSLTVHDQLATLGGTSMFTRLFWLVLGAVLGAAAAVLFDPASGKRRREQLKDHATATGRDLVEEARQRADYVAGQATGAVVETAKSAAPMDLDAPGDPETLRQKIRSEVIGHVDGAQGVVVAVQPEGRVTLKGEVPSPVTERELVAATANVSGVNEVTSELTVS